MGGHTKTAIAALLLAGCATAPQVPTVVKVPVAVPCVTAPLDKPLVMDESVLLALDEYAATIQVWTERLILRAYSEKAEAIIQACR